MKPRKQITTRALLIACTTVLVTLAPALTGCASRTHKPTKARNAAQATAHKQKPAQQKRAESSAQYKPQRNIDYVALDHIVMPREFAEIGSRKPLTGQDITKIAAYYEKLYWVDRHFILAVIKAESNFNSRAVSSCGARGLMQLMPATARSLGVRDSFHPAQNIAGGTLYLAKQVRAFGDNARLVLAAYNAGPGNVKKHSGVPPFKSTRDYIERVLKYRKQYAQGKVASMQRR